MLRRVMAAAVLAFGGASCPAAEPEGPKAVFGIDGSLVTVSLSRAGDVPVVAKLLVTLPGGGKWAEGETDEHGKCVIPMPDAPWCAVEFQIEGAHNPPVTLTFVDDGKAVVPLVAPLEPGECCKITRRFPPDDDAPPPSRWRLSPWPVAAVACVVLMIPLAIVRGRRVPAGREGP